MRTEPFICRPVERFSVVGMGDAGQEFGTFLQTAAIEIYTAKFGYNPVCVGSRGDDSGARVQLRYNLSLALEGAGGECGDALAAFGHICAADEVELAAGAAEYSHSDGVGANLAGEVNLNRGVDCLHMRIAGDDPRVVGVFDRTHIHFRVVVYEGVNILTAKRIRPFRYRFFCDGR